MCGFGSNQFGILSFDEEDPPFALPTRVDLSLSHINSKNDNNNNNNTSNNDDSILGDSPIRQIACGKSFIMLLLGMNLFLFYYFFKLIDFCIKYRKWKIIHLGKWSACTTFIYFFFSLSSVLIIFFLLFLFLFFSSFLLFLVGSTWYWRSARHEITSFSKEFRKRKNC